MTSWTDHTAVRDCRLSGLIDMKQSKEYVQEKQVTFRIFQIYTVEETIFTVMESNSFSTCH